MYFYKEQAHDNITHNVQKAAHLNVSINERHNECLYVILTGLLRLPHLKVTSLEDSNIGLFVV